MTIRFDGRVAIVTGAGNGLGRDYALQLARRGAKVVVNDLGRSGSGTGESTPAAEAVAAEIRAAGGEAVANRDSVATRAGGQAIIDQAMQTWGRVDIVINNAGFLRNGRFEDLGDAEIDAMVDVHLKGAFYVTQPAYKVMKQQGYGRILFTASSSGLLGHPWQANYGAAKAGVVGLMNVVSNEGLRHGILANALMPTAATRLGSEMGPGWMEDGPTVAADMMQINWDDVLPRMAVEYTTPLVLYLVSEACQSTHSIYSSVAGRHAKVVIGVGQGWSQPLSGPATPEDVQAHWAEVTDAAGLHQPLNNYAEFLPVIAKLQSAKG